MDNVLRLYKLDENGVKQPFPDAENNVISTFTYSAKRMGGAPTISCTFKYPTCLDNYWNENVIVEFREETFFVRKTPTSSYSNTEALYSHEVTLVSERIILENVYFFDVVSDNNGDYQPVTNSTSVPFFGTIYEFAKRLNYSLQYSGLQIADKETGNYVSGYRVIVDPVEQGTDKTLYEKGYLITAQDQFFANVLQESYNTYKIPYYFKGKEIHIGFGSLGEVITEANNEPFEYGIDHSLLSIKKQNSNNKIVNRITGVGSADNIPYYYPNPTSVGTIHAEFNQDGQIKNDDVVEIDAEKFLAATSLDKEITFDYITSDFDGTSSYYYQDIEAGMLPITFKEGTHMGTFYAYKVEYVGEGVHANNVTNKTKWYYKLTFDVTCTKNSGSFLMKLIFNPYTIPHQQVANKNPEQSIQVEEIIRDKDGNETKVVIGAMQKGNDNLYRGDFPLGHFTNKETRNFVMSFCYELEIIPDHESYSLAIDITAGLVPVKPEHAYIWTYEGKEKYNISDFGIELKSSVAEDIEKNPSKYDGTSFKVVRDKYIQPQPNLMPSIYRDSNGAERFYNAINDTYDDGAGNKITFPKPYIEGHPSEHTENFDDIKPTIKGMVNSDLQPFDQFLAIAYDKDDNDEQDAEGKYYHPYFFAKLPKYDDKSDDEKFGFNLFEHAIDEGEMSISMTSGHCGACEFVIVVDEKDKKNKVQVDEYGNLMYNPNGNVICGRKEYVDGEWQPQKEKSDPKDEQNDTRNNEVWVALRKDYNTFGTLYPKKGSIEPEKRKDTFVILHIDMPQQYVEAAEKRLDDALIKYMLENNEEKFSFSMNMSRIYLANNPDIREKINENSKVKIRYNGIDHTLYISSYTYKASGNDALPEITVELKDAVTIQKNAVENAVGQVKTDLLSTLNPQNIALQVMQYFIRKDVNDIAKGRITFQQGLTSLGRAIFGDSIQSENYVGGLDVGRGWSIDNNGNAEFESLRVRSLLEVVELVINRLQAQEGDMLFTDNDQIDYVSVYTSGEETSYILTLKEKYEGYIHTQAYGNILKGTINTLAAQHAGVTDDLWLKNDYSDVAPAELESDIAGNTYYTSWMRVVGTYKTEPTVCDVNQIRVVLYGDGDTPANKNFIPCELMTIARWGCIDYSEEVEVLDNLKKEEGLGDNVKPEDAKATISKSIERRQRLFSISNSDGRIVKLRKVNQPKLEKHNYGTTIGILPDFVQEYSGLDGRLEETKDYLYARGIVVSDIIKITPTGDPIINYVDCGEWVDGSKVSEPSEPKLGKGKYLYNAYNADTAQWETHDVWHYGLKWRCLQSQPVELDGTTTYYEPTWDSAYWQPIEGDMSLTMEFTSSNGYSFRRNAAWETTITPHIFFGSMEITKKVTNFRWERTHEEQIGDSDTLDTSWNDNHEEIKELELTQKDMSVYWSSKNKMIFTCIAEVIDGNNTIIVENQITA
jgi:hypothetical protein